MRNVIFTFILLLNVVAINAQQTFSHPIDYNNFIVEEMNQIVVKNLEYISQSVHSDNFEAIEAKRKNVIRQIQGAYKNVNNQEAFKNGEQLKIESLAVLGMYKKVFELELSEANMLKQTSQESYEAMEREYILRVLKAKQWRIGGASGAASALDLNVNTLRGKMKKLGIKKPPLR